MSRTELHAHPIDATVDPLDTLDDFTRGYLDCALWSSNDESDESGGDPLDDNYSLEDIDPEALASTIADCAAFQESEEQDLAEYERQGRDASHAGHDFWLTRNGHGAGFWDRGMGALGDRLSKASKPYGSCYLYVGDDGKIHGF